MAAGSVMSSTAVVPNTSKVSLPTALALMPSFLHRGLPAVYCARLVTGSSAPQSTSLVGNPSQQPAPGRHGVYLRSMHGYTQDKDAYLKRLRRIEGQVRGLQRMVEDDTYCIDVLTQISAATRALQAVAVGLLEDHLGHCVTQAIEQGGPDAEAKVKEAAQAVSRLVKS